MTAAISGEVLNAGLAHTRRPGFRLFSALVQDPSGQIQAVWPNQAFLKDVIHPHQKIVLFGKVEFWGSRGLQITDPEFEIIKDDTAGNREPEAGNREIETLHTGRIVPVYERTGSVTPNMQRRFVWQALESVAARRVRSGAARTSSRRKQLAVAAGCPLAGAFSRRHDAGRGAQCLHDPRAAPVDLRGLLRLSDRPRAAAS